MGKKGPFKKYAIRQNHATRHPHILTNSQGNKYKSVGLTHSKTTKGRKNIPMVNNPNPADKRKSYLISKPFIFKRRRYGKTYSSWHLSEKDKCKVDRISNKKASQRAETAQIGPTGVHIKPKRRKKVKVGK